MPCPFAGPAESTADGCPASPAGEKGMSSGGVYYHSYLGLDKVLDAQECLSSVEEEQGGPAHEELLFIITHQAYELWFKQILHEIDSVQRMFKCAKIAESDVQTIVHRLKRCKQIWKHLVDQFLVLETMTPQEFLKFRDFLNPASGFQSVQFRLIENKLGLKQSMRLKHHGEEYTAALKEEHAGVVSEAEREPSLLELVEAWLERIPFLQTEDFDFWAVYCATIHKQCNDEREQVLCNPTLDEEARAATLEELQQSHQSTLDMLDESKHEAMRARHRKQLSFKATQAALLISTYQSEPILTWPYQLLTELVEIDEMMGNWRHRHAQMVHRMLGMKSGTGGSSGYMYLRSTVDRHRIFTDLFDLSTYLIPVDKLPPLPEAFQENLCVFDK